MNQLYDTFCRVWAAGGQATLTTSSLAGMVTAKLEVQLGQPTAARPGAPSPHLRHPSTFVSTSSAAPAPGAARRPCHRGPAAKAKARARAAAHQAVKAAASAATSAAASAAASAASRRAPPLPSPSDGAPPSVAASHTGGAPPSSSVSGASSQLPLASPPGSGGSIVFSPQSNSWLKEDEDSDEDGNHFFYLDFPIGDASSASLDPPRHPLFAGKRLKMVND